MRFLIYLIGCIFLFSCTSSNTPPDVSNIKVNLSTSRFEQQLFAIDSSTAFRQVDSLVDRNGEFGIIFMTQILNADPRWSSDTIGMYVGGFINSYKPLYLKSKNIFGDFTPFENQIKTAMQFVKYYFSDFLKKNKSYHLPEKIITYIGPLDGYGDNFLPGDAFIVGLHHHLGKNDSLYQSDILHQTYPQYITQRFEPSTIVVNAMTRLLNDMYPPKNEDETLINQMIESGKRYYVLKKILPEKPDELLIGFDYNQYQFCKKNEAQIWNFFVKNELLQIRDPELIRNYIGDSPKTQEFGDESPGNIGSFVGWRIVDKYMNESEDISLDELMSTPADNILSKAKYKP